jgi:predicted SAM-dependent methyltransferase
MNLKQAANWTLFHATPGSWRVFSTLRFEARAAYQRAVMALSPQHHRQIAALRKQTGLSINLGSGGKGKPGWVNTDLQAYRYDNGLPVDIRKPLPFASGSARRILAEHVIEHIDFHYEVPSVFAECYRVLEKGGVFRVIVPDLALYCHAYVNGGFKELGWDLANLPADIPTPMCILNHVFHQGGEHLFGWDWETMELCLKRAGFSQVVRSQFGVSLDHELAIDQENHKPYSLYVEAVK